MKEFETAVRLSPTYATGRQWYALNLAALGRRDAALVEIQKAEQLDPESIAILADHCQILYFAERYDDAIGKCKSALEKDPRSVRTHELLYQVYSTNGRYDDAVREFISAQSFIKNDRIQILAQQVGKAYDRDGVAGFHHAIINFYSAIGTSYKLARVLSEAGHNTKRSASSQKPPTPMTWILCFLAPTRLSLPCQSRLPAADGKACSLRTAKIRPRNPEPHSHEIMVEAAGIEPASKGCDQ